MAREKKSQEWLADLFQEPDECEGRRPPCSVAVTERPWRPLWDETFLITNLQITKL